MAERLIASGAEVQFCDPYIADVNTTRLHLPIVPFSEAALQKADLVVVLVDHPEFEPSLIARHAQLVFDTKNFLGDVTFAGETL